MFPTKNDIPENVRHQSEALLQIFLADAIDLQLQTKQAHWNIRGPRFISLHKLFDKAYQDVVTAVDSVAERIVQLGGVAEGTVEMVAKNSSLAEFPPHITDERELLVILTDDMSSVARLGRRGIHQASEWEDLVTADILTDAVRSLDKNVWMMESHLTQRDREDVRKTLAQSEDTEYMSGEGWRAKDAARQHGTNY